jgi:hypothetical protein
MTFAIVPGSKFVLLALGAAGGALLVAGSLVVWLAVSSSALSLRWDGDDLVLNVPLFGRRVPIDRLDLARAQVLTIDSLGPHAPVLRTNGVGLQGYEVGWFRLADGDKALLALTSRQRALYLPTRDGYVLLLSVAEPAPLLDRLRQWQAAHPPR